uniref:Murein L,D-transpeptidase YafK n=1 Tax=Candidatus Kentrum eta TaxID=2126337 RepID=A0A450VF71_9GAMM|nr:MAG: Murein L,D-transpeptidase YafK [Candidatus Kentron sp. H]VFK03906.1 MAG: Murein L,D-transpeptidase YafK [Candidatus Kentron sp. H]VFK06471.1 MAG: Murein L,D-transpeptidase YafK [Candidatus Kentron sp. H]
MQRSFSLVFLSAFLYFVLGFEPTTGVTLILDTHLNNIPSHPQQHSPLAHETEKTLMDSLHAIRERRLDAALDGIETLIGTHPEFRLAQLIYGDLLLSKSQLITSIGNWPNAPRDKILGLREEARQRVKHYLHRPYSILNNRHRNAQELDTLPGYLIRVGKNLGQAVIMDIGQSRFYAFENHGAGIRLRGSYYASVGKNGFPKQSEGDQKTPIGVYLTVGSIPSDKLPDRYGVAAFPVNYPNEWDSRFGRTGHGIWIHGVPSNTYSRPPFSSDGCIAIANEDLLSMKDILAVPNTPVIIAEHVPWIDRREITARHGQFETQFDRWCRDWESQNHSRYAKHYSKEFQNETKNRASWLQSKRNINAEKRHIRVEVSNLSILGYPGERNTLVVIFDQDYRSNNYNRRSRKRQYWRWERNKTREAEDNPKDGVWRIVYEGSF